MMDRIVKCGLLIAACAVFLPIATADVNPDEVTCFVCESPNPIGTDNDACLVPNDDTPTVNCTRAASTEPEPRCFKTKSTMVDNLNVKEYMVVRRGCELKAPWTGCETSIAPSGGNTAECYCHADKCNGSSALSTTWAALLSLAAVVLMRAC